MAHGPIPRGSKTRDPQKKSAGHFAVHAHSQILKSSRDKGQYLSESTHHGPAPAPTAVVQRSTAAGCVQAASRFTIYACPLA